MRSLRAALSPRALAQRPAARRRRLLWRGIASTRPTDDRNTRDTIVPFEERCPQTNNTKGQQPIQFTRAIPDGDDKERDVCQLCGFVAYSNPKVVAGAVLFRKGSDPFNPSILLGPS